MDNEIAFDREMYRRLKGMSREQLSEVLGSFYAKGKSDTLSSIKRVRVDFNKIRGEISGIKGIGEVRLKLIMEIVERNLRKPKL